MLIDKKLVDLQAIHLGYAYILNSNKIKKKNNKVFLETAIIILLCKIFTNFDLINDVKFF